MIGEPSGRTVLLVDDDDTFRRVLQSELSRRGYDVTVAATGREAVDRTTFRFDLCLGGTLT